MSINTQGLYRYSFKNAVWLGLFLIVLFTSATALGSTLADDQNPNVSISLAVPTVTPTRLHTPTVISSNPILPQSSNTARSLRLPSQPILDQNTVALYHLDASSGSNSIDATGNLYGTLHGNAIITPSALYARSYSWMDKMDLVTFARVILAR